MIKASFLLYSLIIAVSLTYAAFVVKDANIPSNSNIEVLKSVVAELKDVVDKHQTSINAQDATIASLTKKAEYLENGFMKRKEGMDPSVIKEGVSRRLQALPDLSCISYESNAYDLIFSGCNVQIRNGKERTATINHRGNLIVGYNEDDGKNRQGSHNVVVGTCNSYSSYAGIVAGCENYIATPFTNIKGGSQNIAYGWYSSILGGANNRVSGLSASILGGWRNNRNVKYATAWQSRFNER